MQQETLRASEKDASYLKRSLESVYIRFHARQEDSITLSSESQLQPDALVAKSVEVLQQRDDAITQLSSEVAALRQQLSLSNQQATDSCNDSQANQRLVKTTIPTRSAPDLPTLKENDQSRLDGSTRPLAAPSPPPCPPPAPRAPPRAPPAPSAPLQRAALLPSASIVARGDRMMHNTSSAVSSPPPPPPPPLAAFPKDRGLKVAKPITPAAAALGPKLKPFHWSKVADAVSQNTVWQEIKVDQVHLDLKLLQDEFAATLPTRDATERTPDAPQHHVKTLLSTTRANNIGIMLARTKLSPQTICEAFTTVNDNKMDLELLKALKQNSPTTDEVGASLAPCVLRI